MQLVSVVPTDPSVLSKLGELYDSEQDKSQAFQYHFEVRTIFCSFFVQCTELRNNPNNSVDFQQNIANRMLYPCGTNLKQHEIDINLPSLLMK